MNRRSAHLPSIALAVFCGAAAAGAEPAAAPGTFYVSPHGRDTWSGRLADPVPGSTDGPFASLERARAAARVCTAEGMRDVTVWVRGGTYRLAQTASFGVDDSACEGGHVTYAAFRGEQPVFSGARPVTAWTPLSGVVARRLPPVARPHVWVADISSYAAFRTLYDGEGALPRARGRGFSSVNVTPRGSKDCRTVVFSEGAVQAYADTRGLELRIVPSYFWIMNLLPIASIDYDSRTLLTAVPGTYPLGRNGMKDRDSAWIENALEDLDAPGEWVRDDAGGRLYLWPRAGGRPVSVVAPALTELIRVEGNVNYPGPTDEPVRGLVFCGLTFAHGDRYPFQGRTGWGVQHDWESFDKPTALVRFRGAEACGVEDCTFRDSGHTALRLDLHARRIWIVGNHIHHVGGVGVLLAGYGPGTKDVNRDNVIANNHIHHVGREYWGSAAIFAWQSGHNRIVHNLVHHLPYTGILATGRISRGPAGEGECSRTVRDHELPANYRKSGWRQRQAYLHTRDNLIASNDVHHVMETLGDGNCIYVSGAGGGNIVCGNYCHDSFGAYMNAVIRCDDDQHDTLIERNICFRTAGHGEGIISKGDNDIFNNVLADLRGDRRHRGMIVFPYGNIRGSRVERNIFYSTRREQMTYHHSHDTKRGSIPRLADATVNSNLYFCTVDPAWPGADLEAQRRDGADGQSVIADPLFTDVVSGDFRFAAGSPAARLGILPLDANLAGLEEPYRSALLGRPVETRVFPADGIRRAAVTVRMSCTAAGAIVRYTLDGSEPTARSVSYAGPFPVTAPVVVRARAFGPGITDHVGARACYAAPPSPLTVSFENGRPGQRVAGAETLEDAGAARYTARLSAARAAEGRQSLCLKDGPGQRQSFTPHVVWRCRYDEGQAVGRIAVCVDARSHLSWQWRHYERGYRSGPALEIQPGGRVVHRGRTLMVIPLETWVVATMTCGLGDASAGTFDLALRVAGADDVRRFTGLRCDMTFRRLDWLGLVTRSAEDSVCYVDDMRVRAINAGRAGENGERQ